jgi:cytochrome b involved in lipid metabolism
MARSVPALQDSPDESALAGRDATEAFEDVGHSDEARAMLPKMFVGEFNGEVGDDLITSLSSAALGRLTRSFRRRRAR